MKLKDIFFKNIKDLSSINNRLGSFPLGLRSSNIAWSSYWSHQSEVLFFGLYSEISGGQMPNKVTGATDFLTVVGVAGSETYQCPNTAAYIAADTDYIWFKTDTTQRTTTTAELIGYDLQRTPVKYEDNAPNSIIAIMILKAGAVLSATKRNYLFRDMWLSILWDNSLNAYGHIKSNRVGQQLWTPEPIYPAILSDGNTVAWFMADNLTNIVMNGSNQVSQWNDSSGSNNHLLQGGIDSIKPIYNSGIITFDGVGQYLKCNAFALNQPTILYMVIKQVSWNANDYLFDGNAVSTGALKQVTSTPQVALVCPSTSPTTSNFSVGNFHVVTVLFSGVNSFIKIDANGEESGNPGTSNMGGFTLGCRGSIGSYGSIAAKEIIIRKVNDSIGTAKADIQGYLKNKHGL